MLEPFQHLIVSAFIGPDGLAAINADYPKISSSGSFPVDQVSFGPEFQNLLDELESDEFREAFEEKFGLDLSGRPTVTTVRGRCDLSDGRIHTDSTSKIITVLIYMNESWEEAGGRLRLLRSAKNLSDIIVEVPPIAGTLLAFRRSNNSWHGHEPFNGERRVIQFNWLTSQGNRQIAMLRHLLPRRSSACCKKSYRAAPSAIKRSGRTTAVARQELFFEHACGRLAQS